ncbi:flagellar protein FlgN [candidate division KSB1 bacterium]|nr:flagellar protein FlgN [candidate division KSB1 bacterium]
MELIVYRLIQIMKRQLSTFNELQACLINQKDEAARAQTFDLLETLEHEKCLLREIGRLELDSREECQSLIRLMKWPSENWPMKALITRIQREIGKCNRCLSKLCDELLWLIEKTRTQNLSLQKLAQASVFFHPAPIQVIHRFKTFRLDFSTQNSPHTSSHFNPTIVDVK